MKMSWVDRLLADQENTLQKPLTEFGIKREDVFITNIVKHVSPKNRKPFPDEVAACLPYLITQIRFVKPKIIVLLGASAKDTPRIDGIEYIRSNSSIGSNAFHTNARKI